MQCSELCGVQLGPPLYEKVKALLAECHKQRPDSGYVCEDELKVRPDLLSEAKKISDRCLVDCGFPDLDAMKP